MLEQELVAKIEEIQSDHLSRMNKELAPYLKQLAEIRGSRQRRRQDVYAHIGQQPLSEGFRYDQRYHFPDGTLKGIQGPLTEGSFAGSSLDKEMER